MSWSSAGGREAEEVGLFTRRTTAQKLLFTDISRATVRVDTLSQAKKRNQRSQPIRTGVGWVLGEGWDPY